MARVQGRLESNGAAAAYAAWGPPSSIEQCGSVCAETSSCTHFTWDERKLNTKPFCYLFSGLGIFKNRTQANVHSGILPSARVSPAFLMTNDLINISDLSMDETSGEVTYVVKLSTYPLVGAVWLTPRVKVVGADGQELLIGQPEFTPSKIVFYRDDWNRSKAVRASISLQSMAQDCRLTLTHELASCDSAFGQSLATATLVIPYRPSASANSTLWETLVVIMTVLGTICLISLAFWQRMQRRALERGRVRVLATGVPPELSMAEGMRFHLFISHVWATGQGTLCFWIQHV